MGRSVALKVLRQSLSDDPEQVARFKREAQAASQLQHPNTLIVDDSTVIRHKIERAVAGHGVEVVGQAEDGSWGAVRVYNAAMDYRLTADRETLAPGETVNLEALMSNRGAVASPRISVSLEARIDGRTFHDAPLGPPTELAVGATLTRTASVTLPADPPSAAGARVELIARFDDGDQVWERRLLLALTAPPRLYLPALLDRSGIEVP